MPRLFLKILPRPYPGPRGYGLLVFLDFSSRKRSRASCEAATTSRESDEERDSLSPLRGLLLISLARKNQEKPLGPGYGLGRIFKKRRGTFEDTLSRHPGQICKACSMGAVVCHQANRQVLANAVG